MNVKITIYDTCKYNLDSVKVAEVVYKNIAGRGGKSPQEGRKNMYGKFDKYDLFEACKTAQEIYNEAIQDGVKSRWGKDKAETGYILLRTIIASHGLDGEYEAWHNSQTGNAAADFVLRCTK